MHAAHVDPGVGVCSVRGGSPSACVLGVHGGRTAGGTGATGGPCGEGRCESLRSPARVLPPGCVSTLPGLRPVRRAGSPGVRPRS